jgi:hypothetical protein
MSKSIVGVDSAKVSFTAASVWAKQVTYQGECANTASGCAAFIAEME